jgi:hypothetical protein
VRLSWPSQPPMTAVHSAIVAVVMTSMTAPGRTPATLALSR